MKSLRSQLVFFWVLLFSVCAALAVVMLTLYRASAGAQIDAGRTALDAWLTSLESLQGEITNFLREIRERR